MYFENFEQRIITLEEKIEYIYNKLKDKEPKIEYPKLPHLILVFIFIIKMFC